MSIVNLNKFHLSDPLTDMNALSTDLYFSIWSQIKELPRDIQTSVLFRYYYILRKCMKTISFDNMNLARYLRLLGCHCCVYFGRYGCFAAKVEKRRIIYLSYLFWEGLR